MELNYSEDVSIDETALDVEWLSQPKLLMQYSREMARTKLKLDKAKQNLDVVKAGLDKEIRTNPDKYGLAKITEGAVNNTIILQDEYINVSTEILETQYEYDMVRNAVSAIASKKDALENLVKLHGMNYFSGPSVPRDISKEWEEKEKQKTANGKVKPGRRRK